MHQLFSRSRTFVQIFTELRFVSNQDGGTTEKVKRRLLNLKTMVLICRNHCYIDLYYDWISGKMSPESVGAHLFRHHLARRGKELLALLLCALTFGLLPYFPTSTLLLLFCCQKRMRSQHVIRHGLCLLGPSTGALAVKTERLRFRCLGFQKGKASFLKSIGEKCCRSLSDAQSLQ
jgi:hypothetical protein